jgi:hypothetical protein
LVYPLGGLKSSEELPWNRSLAGALYQACLFNIFARAPKLTSANHRPLHQDVFGALVGVHSTLFFGQTNWRNSVFYVFQMYSKMAGREVPAVEVQSPVYSTPAIGIVPYSRTCPVSTPALAARRTVKSSRHIGDPSHACRGTSLCLPGTVDGPTRSFSLVDHFARLWTSALLCSYRLGISFAHRAACAMGHRIQ